MMDPRNTPTKNETFREALEVWGWEMQSLVFVEEMAEVIKEVMKIHRAIFFQEELDLTKFVEKMADLKLMFDQIRYDFTAKEQDAFQKEYGYKLDRARRWLKEGEPQ